MPYKPTTRPGEIVADILETDGGWLTPDTVAMEVARITDARIGPVQAIAALRRLAGRDRIEQRCAVTIEPTTGKFRNAYVYRWKEIA